MHVNEVLGNASSRPGAEVDFAIIHEDQAVAFTLDYSGETLKEGEEAYLQVAVLYTNMKGARVVRVHNLAIPVTSSLVSIFKHADLETTTCVLKNLACRDILQPKATFTKVRKAQIQKCVDILEKYRRHCGPQTQASQGQLILPESLKLLPLYTLAMLKSPILRVNKPKQQGAGPTGFGRREVALSADDRANFLLALGSMPVYISTIVVHPRLYNLTNLEEGDGLPEKSSGTLLADSLIQLPQPISPSAEKLDPSSIMLLDNGFELYLHITRAPDPQQLLALFGKETIEECTHLFRFVFYRKCRLFISQNS